MASPLVVLAHEPSAARHAQRITSDLKALGFKVGESVGTTVGHKQAAKLNSAHRVVMLWTRAAWRAPALRAAAQRAKAKGKLVCVVLDAAPPPAAGQAVRLSPRGRLAWRRLLRSGGTAAQAKAPMTRLSMQPRQKRTPRPTLKAIAAAPAVVAHKPAMRAVGAPMLAALTALALVVLAAGAEAYTRDAVFAEKLNGFAQTAQTRATELIRNIAPGG